MREIRPDQIGDPPPPGPEGYEGHESIGFNCTRCGAHVKGQPTKFVRIHNEWHAKHDD